MESTERHVRTWIASQRPEEISKVAAEINSGQTTLLNVVKALGEYLTSEEDSLRTRGVEFLSFVLAECQHEAINRKSAHVLTAFYCSKLEDFETMLPALRGLVSLVKFPSCSDEDAVMIAEGLFTHVKMKSLVQAVRLLVFTIIDGLMARNRQALLNMGKGFISCYLNLAEGEKDPRNLMVAFAIARVILIEFDIDGYVEALFNITFCYFPITFRPPPNDPYGITTEDLRDALRSCLSATPAFGPMAIPVFLEKLLAGSPVTKRDTLQTMSICLPVYGAAVTRSSAKKIWGTVKLEIFQPTDSLTEQEALKTFQALIKTIYAENVDTETEAVNENVEGFAKDSCQECIDILREPEKSQAKHAIKVISAFMSTTPSVAKYALAQAVPHLIELYRLPDNSLARVSILSLLSELIAASRDSSSRAEVGTVPPFMPFKDEVLGTVVSALTQSQIQQPAIACLLGMVSTEGLLTDEELGYVVHNVTELLQTTEEGDEARESALKLLSTISLHSAHHIEEQTLPSLFSSLPDSAPARDDHEGRAKYRQTLTALRVLCPQTVLFETFIVRLTTRLDLLCLSEKIEDDECTAAYAHAILTTINQTLALKVEEVHSDVSKYMDKLVPRLFNLFIYSALVEGRSNMVAWELRLIKVAGQIINLVVQSTPIGRQEPFVVALFDAFFSGEPQKIVDGLPKLPVDKTFQPFEDNSPVPQKNLAVLFIYAISGLRKEVKTPVADLDKLLDKLLLWGLSHAENDSQREAAWQSIACLVNKRIDDTKTFTSGLLESFWTTHVTDTSKAVDYRRNAIQAWTWVSKALLLRTHASSPDYTDKLFSILSDSSVAWDAARAIGNTVSPDQVLSKRNHAVLKILYAQKYVSRVLPRIMQGATDSDKQEEQSAYLVALASLIKATPKSTYLQHMSSLVPLLLRGLELPDYTIRANVIDTLASAVEGDSPDESLISDHTSSLVATMLKNSVASQTPSMRVRASALRYLGMLPRIVRHDLLQRHKAFVLKELAKALDDPKRSVRAEAVDARTNWFLLNSK